MTDPFTRRALLRQAGAGMLLTGAGAAAAQGAAPGAPDMAARRVINAAEAGADRTGRSDASAALQQAIDALAPTGGTLYLPAGEYRIDRTLVWQNNENRRAPGILFQGDGQHSTVLISRIRSGPILKVRGVRTTPPVQTSLFWGGGIRDLSLRGTNAGPDQHGLEVLGWYYGEIQNCHFVGFGGDGIRATTDLQVNPNPDFTSSNLFVRGVWFERLGGWGFIDTSEAQGAPGWSWDRTVFIMCRKGGAHVRSGGHSFTTCSFGRCGWQGERTPPAPVAYGLYFDGGATACAQQIVQGCEFDSNRTAHIGARFLSTSCFFANRFIFSDRFNFGRTHPDKGIELGVGGAGSIVMGLLFRQSFFRTDLVGDVVGFDFTEGGYLRDIEIGGAVFTQPAGARVTRYRGHNPGGRGADWGLVVHDRYLTTSTN